MFESFTLVSEMFTFCSKMLTSGSKMFIIGSKTCLNECYNAKMINNCWALLTPRVIRNHKLLLSFITLCRYLIIYRYIKKPRLKKTCQHLKIYDFNFVWFNARTVKTNFCWIRETGIDKNQRLSICIISKKYLTVLYI